MPKMRSLRRRFAKRRHVVPDTITVDYLAANFNAVMREVEGGRIIEVDPEDGDAVVIIPADHPIYADIDFGALIKDLPPIMELGPYSFHKLGIDSPRSA